MQFLKLTHCNDTTVLVNVAHIVDVCESKNGENRLITTTNVENMALPVKETIYQIEQALDHIAANPGYAVAMAARWPVQQNPSA